MNEAAVEIILILYGGAYYEERKYLFSIFYCTLTGRVLSYFLSFFSLSLLFIFLYFFYFFIF